VSVPFLSYMVEQFCDFVVASCFFFFIGYYVILGAKKNEYLFRIYICFAERWNSIEKILRE
jgi:ammonia channel protein AmtB